MTTDLLGKIMALLCAVVWAGAVILFKLAGDRIRPLALNLYKTALTVILLFPVLLLLRVPLFPAAVPGRHWLAVMASGILGIAVSDTLFFACLNRLGAGMTAIVDALYAPFVMTATWLVLLQRPRLEQIGGALLVIAAVLVVAYRKSGSPLPTRRVMSGIFFGVAAMAIMAVSIVLMQPVLSGVSVFWVTELRMLSALAVLLLMFAWQKERRQLLAPLWQKGEPPLRLLGGAARQPDLDDALGGGVQVHGGQFGRGAQPDQHRLRGGAGQRVPQGNVHPPPAAGDGPGRGRLAAGPTGIAFIS